MAAIGWSRSRRVSGVWSEPETDLFQDIDSFWSAHDHWCDRDSTHYTVSPGCAGSLTLLGLWDRVLKGEVSIRKGRTTPDPAAACGIGTRSSGMYPLILSRVPDVVGYRIGRSVHRWVGSEQFGQPDLDLTGDAVASSRVVLEWFISILNGWIGTQCGRWCDTIGAAAWATYQRRTNRTKIFIHSNPEVCQIESKACHGGRASAWYYHWVGQPRPGEPAWTAWERTGIPVRYTGPVHRLDVRGQYPTLMRDQRFPVRLIGITRKPTVDQLHSISQVCGVIADVNLIAQVSEYPVARGKDKIYPRGRFRATLAGPDLVHALGRGEVERVHAVARYELGEPFREWSKWVLSLRTTAKHHPGPGWNWYVKALSVALSGRLARTRKYWENRPKIASPILWGEWHHLSEEKRSEVTYRSIGGHTQELVLDDRRPGTLAACYAYLTAYSRQQMRAYRDIAGEGTVLAQHTDGLLVTTDGLTRLAQSGSIRIGEWGQLQHECDYQSVWVRGSAHHYHDGTWTIAGVRPSACYDDREGIQSESEIEPTRSARSPARREVILRYVTVDPTRQTGIDRVGEDGWSIPYRLRSRTEEPSNLFGGEP